MKELIDLLLGYPTWVKIVVITLVFTIVVLLVFFRPESQSQKHPDRESLATILRLRFETISTELDSISDRLEKAGKQNDPEADAEMAKLRDLRNRFRTFHEKHIAAVLAGDILVAHDLVREIHSMLAEIEATVRSREGSIARSWFASLPRAYIVTPEERYDPEYHAVMREVSQLSEATVDRVKSIRYPGSAPESVRVDLRALAFENPESQFPSQ